MWFSICYPPLLHTTCSLKHNDKLFSLSYCSHEACIGLLPPTGFINKPHWSSIHGDKWYRPKIYSTWVCYCRPLIFRRCKTSLKIDKNPANRQHRFIVQEGPIGTKWYVSLTNDTRAIPDACRTYIHLSKSLAQKHTKSV